MQTQHLTAGFIGLGLIGGSIARALKKIRLRPLPLWPICAPVTVF
mgnify:CR=1 FL=1